MYNYIHIILHSCVAKHSVGTGEVKTKQVTRNKVAVDIWWIILNMVDNIEWLIHSTLKRQTLSQTDEALGLTRFPAMELFMFWTTSV